MLRREDVLEFGKVRREVEGDQRIRGHPLGVEVRRRLDGSLAVQEFGVPDGEGPHVGTEARDPGIVNGDPKTASSKA